MKRVFAFLCAAMILLGLCLTVGCGAKSDAVTSDETAKVRGMLEDRHYGTKNLQVYPLYNGMDRPAYLMGVSDNACLICRRRDFRFCESTENCPYGEYLDVKKYYDEPLCYVIRAEDVIGGEETPDGKFYYLRSGEYGSFHPVLSRIKFYSPLLLLLLLAAVVIAVAVRRRKKH